MDGTKGQTDSGNGAAAAALVAAGIGCALIGVTTILAEASGFVKETLDWWSPAGPLTGKTGTGVLAWLVSWISLHLTWRRRDLPFDRIWILVLTLIAVGWIGTFPPVFESFAPH